MKQIQHCIIGAGPVGLTLAHFFKKFNLPFKIFERKPFLSAHPSAHYVNTRSMEILTQLGIQLPTEDLHQFQNYAYLRRIGEDPLNLTNQLVDSSKFSLNGYAHLPQSAFVQALANQLQGFEQNIQFSSEVTKIVKNADSITVTMKGDQQIQCEYLYGCDGINGFVRDSLGIKLMGKRNIQRFLNVHFESLQLVSRMAKYKSMLSFIYNSDVTAVIIKHQLSNGTFAIQIPLDLLSYDNQNVDSLRQDTQLIKKLINSCLLEKINDVEIKAVGLWQMGAVVAESYYKGKCILVGDACHAMPPAGGFGMNTGIQDAHNLAYKIINGDNLLHYQQERQQIAQDNITTALRFYQKSLDIAKTYGFDYQNLQTYQNMYNYVPEFAQQFYRSGVKLGGSLIELAPFYEYAKKKQIDSIPLVFPKEEIQFKYKSGNIDIKCTAPIVGQLAPLEIRRLIGKTLPGKKWFAINCEFPSHLKYEYEELKSDCQSKLIIRNDLHIFSIIQ